MKRKNDKARVVRKGVVALVATAAVLLTSACTSEGQSSSEEGVVTLSVASFLIDGTPNADMVNWYLDKVEADSEGSIVFDRFPAESLCTGAEIVECVTDGRADLGITVPSYNPDKFPLMNLAALPFMTDDNQAMMNAFYTLYEENEEFAAESGALGLRNVAYWPAGASIFGSTTEINSVDDLEDVRIRAVGDGLLLAMNNAGASPVALTAGEMYEGVERGVIDAVANNMDAPISYKLTEVLPNWTDSGYGHYISIGMWISQDAYDSLSEKQQNVVDNAREALVSGEGMAVFATTAATQCDYMLDQEGVSVTRWSDSAISEFKKLTGDQASTDWIEQATSYGVSDAPAVLDRYEELLAEGAADSESRVAPLAECAERFASR